jgi:chemotaxis signal transduction protein
MSRRTGADAGSAGSPADAADATKAADPSDAAETSRTEARPETVEVLAVRVGGTEFGLPVQAIRTVLHVPTITRLPFPPPSVVGVASVRGSVVPVMDLAERLLGSPGSRTGRLVLIEDAASGHSIGLLVDDVIGLVAGGMKALEPPPEVEASLPAGWIAGILSPDADRLITLLQLAPVLDVSATTDKEQR